MIKACQEKMTTKARSLVIFCNVVLGKTKASIGLDQLYTSEGIGAFDFKLVAVFIEKTRQMKATKAGKHRLFGKTAFMKGGFAIVVIQKF